MSAIHLCLSGSLACSGMNPCEACLLEIRHRVLPRGGYRAGFNGSPEQWHAFLEGYMEGWAIFQQALLTDPALRARVQMRDVSAAQATAPVGRLGDGDAATYGQPATAPQSMPAWPWATSPDSPPGYGANVGPIATAPVPPPPAGPVGTAPAGAPNVVPLAGQPPDPLGVMSLEDLAKIQSASRGGSVVTRKTQAPRPAMSAEDVARAGGPAPKSAPG